MFHHWFAHPWLLALLALLPPLALVATLAVRRRRRALRQLGGAATWENVGPGGRRWLRRLLLALAALMLIVGVAGPQGGRDWEQSAAAGRDWIVVLDMSRSMLAETPSRFERARTAVLDLANTVEQRGGHRIALVIFAARAQVACPLTRDYDHFRETVRLLDATQPPSAIAAEPESISGTRIGLALAAALQNHEPRAHGFQDVLLLSDGDDPARDGDWQPAVDLARQQSIPVHTVGIGDPAAGHAIPLQDGYLEYEGERVLTKLEEKPLQEIARATGGTHSPAQTKALPLGELFRERIEKAGVPAEENDDRLPVPRQYYVWFLAPALGLLALEMLLGAGRRKREIPPGNQELVPRAML
jgi:Ca-activated chloride channel family protein